MILLILTNPRAQECAEAIEQWTAETTQLAATLREGAAKLSDQEFAVVVIDQLLAEAEPHEADVVLERLGMAAPLFVNFAISGIERVSREVRAALNRRRREVTSARKGAAAELRNELKDTVTALLLSCEMALQVQDLPASAETKLRAVDNLAREMRGKLLVEV